MASKVIKDISTLKGGITFQRGKTCICFVMDMFCWIYMDISNIYGYGYVFVMDKQNKQTKHNKKYNGHNLSVCYPRLQRATSFLNTTSPTSYFNGVF